MYSTANEIGREREERYRAIKFLAIIAITAMMAIPIIQHIQNEYASTPVESYSYYNEMVRFVGSDTFIGFDGNIFPVSWNVFEANPNYSPGPQANPFAVSTNNTNTSAPLIEETFSNYTTKRIESVWQNSAVMIKWNHYVKIAEIFSFTNSGIDASIVVKNLNVTNTYISTFSLGMGINSTMAVNGFNPSCQNISSGTGIIPSNDWNVSVGNISVNWQSEDSIFHSGIVSESQSGDQIILPFETGIINHNQSYTIDPMIYYSPYRIIGGPGPSPGPTPTPQRYRVIFTESGLSSGTSWHVTLNGNTQYSTSNTITFSEYDGSYSYTIGSVSGYTDSPSSGYVDLSGGSRSIYIAYATQSYTLTFTESGLSSGTSWTIDLNGNTISTTSSSISFSEPDGSYSYSIGSISGYGLSPSSGTANINGGSLTVSVTYTEMIGNFCPTYSKGMYNINRTLISYNLTQAIDKAYCSSSPGGVSSNYLMLRGEMCHIVFNIPYFNTNSGNGKVNTYESVNNPTVSPDEISGPPGGGSTCTGVFRGMLIYTLTSSGSIDYPIYCNQSLNGNGVVHFSWLTRPGAYGGFMVELVNSKTVARSYYKHPFDVYSRLVNEPYGSCLADSIASTRVYSTSGVYVGNLIITASLGPSSHYCKYNTYIPFGLTSVFYSPYNNVSSNKYTYGILNYNQYLNFTGTQVGSSSGQPVYKPVCALNQGTSLNEQTNNQTTVAAERSLYDLTDTTLLLTADPCIVALGLTMVALGPFVFPGSAPSNTQSYWNTPQSEGSSISYGSWDLGKSGINLPQHSSILVGYVNNRLGPAPIFKPVYPIVNNGNGNPSYTQYLNMILQQQPQNKVVNGSGEFALNYFTYSTSMTVVPIAHCIDGFKLNQNDYVNATWHNYPTWLNWTGGYWNYDGPSYTAAVSLPLYMPLEG